MNPSNSGPCSGSCAQLKWRPGPLAYEADNRIKDAGDLGKQEGPSGSLQWLLQLLDIPVKSVTARWQAARAVQMSGHCGRTGQAEATAAASPTVPLRTYFKQG